MAKRKKPGEPTPPTPSNQPPANPRTAKCPRCAKEFTFTTVASHKTFPFCSQRCRDVDLGNWMMEKYTIAGPPVPQAPREDDTDAT